MSDTKKRRDKEWTKNREFIFKRSHRGKAKRDRRWQECQRKVAYPKRSDAQGIADYLNSRGEGVMSVYKCQCGNYHVGHAEIRKIATLERYAGYTGQIAWAVQAFHRARAAQAAALGHEYEEERDDLTA